MGVDDASAAVIATELRLLKEDLGRRLDDHRDDIRSMRAEMASNYVHHQAYQAEYGRMSDRIANVEADVIEIRTTSAAQIIELHGHIDRRFDEIKEQRRWSWGIVVAAGGALLASVTAIAVALIGTH